MMQILEKLHLILDSDNKVIIRFRPGFLQLFRPQVWHCLLDCFQKSKFKNLKLPKGSNPQIKFWYFHFVNLFQFVMRAISRLWEIFYTSKCTSAIPALKCTEAKCFTEVLAPTSTFPVLLSWVAASHVYNQILLYLIYRKIDYWNLNHFLKQYLI
jgi:hypothetical protein